MLIFLKALQLLLYIALLALVGQGILYALAGPKRDTNFFYKLLQLLAKPFTRPVRWLTPAKVADHQVPIVTFFLLVVVYAVVTFEIVNLCVQSQMAGCR